MRQLVGILARDAKVGGEQGDSLRQLNVRGGIIRLAGGDGGANRGSRLTPEAALSAGFNYSTFRSAP